MKILLDENIPQKLVEAIRAEGHEVESVHTLGIAGVKNGDLYQIAQNQYGLLFTKDSAFNEWAKKIKENHRVKYVLVTLPQKSQDGFVEDFLIGFRKTDWLEHIHGNVWPAR